MAIHKVLTVAVAILAWGGGIALAEGPGGGPASAPDQSAGDTAGNVTGDVTSSGNDWIAVRQDGEKSSVRYFQPKVSTSAPESGASGLVRRLLGTVHVGQRVHLTWKLADQNRIVSAICIVPEIKKTPPVSNGGAKVDPADRELAAAKASSQDPPATRTPGKDGVNNAFARGVVVGKVVVKNGDKSIEVASVNGKTERYMPETPASRGQIAAAEVGTMVALHWYVNDHLRVDKIERYRPPAELTGGTGGATDRGTSGTTRQPQPAADPKLPGDLLGFRGTLVGVITKRGDNFLVLEVQELGPLADENLAPKPGAAVDREIELRADGGSPVVDKVLAAINQLALGDQVSVEAMHFSGEAMIILSPPAKAPAK